ncbi:hypothetical protein EV385_6768 [Krasilnikovia cinnamomea]|uniref:Uncharacterized protein n=1 Tax=Krasilnikovia cinnamomea TaxID=349313 RepID=A0A4Q7Z9F7_9ACTN|nr:hypothetical protein [Krasilnikovia cinnamomea]RZU46691.1 hypothetical protein EV385_6768 [Krasilnikovia cinnamomea]
MKQRSANDQHAHLTPRSALVFLLGLVSGGVAGALTYAATLSVAQAVLAGFGATAFAVMFFDKIIGSAPGAG